MSERNTVVRGMHDLGLAAWFGGSLAGAVGANTVVKLMLTGATMVSASLHGERQRPRQQLSGVLARVVRKLSPAA